MHLEGPCKPIDPGIEAAASFFNSTGRRKQKTRPLKIEISANGRGFLELAYLEATLHKYIFLSTFECRQFARVPGALHARESFYEKQ